MNTLFGNAEALLTQCVSGFHQYILQPTVHLSFVSDSFCSMVGYTQSELISPHTDLYGALVHPADSKIYQQFIQTLSSREQSLTVEYRVIRKDGEVKYFRDTAVSRRSAEGFLTAACVLTDITALKQENDDLHFLNETIPCGFLRYTCEKIPKVTYVNDRMLQFLRLPDTSAGQSEFLDLYAESIYLWIPVEDRQRFAQFLERVYESNEPVAGEMNILRCDGTRGRLYGWITKSINQSGQAEFQSVCMDITQRYEAKKAKETNQYLNAISKVYDKTFRYDFSQRTVTCLESQNSNSFRWLQDIPMQMEEATEKWIVSSVCDADRDMMLAYFRNYFQPEMRAGDVQPPPIRYTAMSSDGTMKQYVGIFLKIDSNVSLYCCRRTSEESDSRSLQSENASLRNMNENMQELVLRFTDGIVAFELENGFVKPLYVSDNICGFFGYTREEWSRMARHRLPIQTFVSKCSVGYDAFMTLLEQGEAEFDYADVSDGSIHRVRAACYNMFADDASRQYVMLYNVPQQETPPDAPDQTSVQIRTFGYFDVFVDDKPIPFRNEKSKELLALLVDRRGGYVSSEEAISFLWEDEAVCSVTLARYRKVALRLKNILEEYGVSDIVESVNGKRRIVAERVRCDLYDYLTGAEEYAQLFKGSYLSNYSWGENTLGQLLNEHSG